VDDQQISNHSGDQEAAWRKILIEGGHAELRFARRIFPLLPAAPRCKFCNSPFAGIGGRICGAIGMTPSRKNPQLCALCCEKMPPGGAEVEIAVLFADIRGSTALAEQLAPTPFAAILNRFYATATDVLVRHQATLDKLIGDEVMAFFVPGFAGPAFTRSSVAAGEALLRAIGYGTEAGPWISVGIGIDAGTAFVGNVGGSQFIHFTALGDPVNTAARLRSAARPGEILVGEAVFAVVAEDHPHCEARPLEVKGKERPISAYSIPLHGMA
jgi:adenylate cyclase